MNVVVKLSVSSISLVFLLYIDVRENPVSLVTVC